VTKLPVISDKKVVKALSRVGFFVHHQKGSHIVLRRTEPPFERVVVSDHKAVKKGTLQSIIQDAGLTREEFLALL